MKASWLKLAACLLPLTFIAATCKQDKRPEPEVAQPAGSTGAAAKGSTTAAGTTPPADNAVMKDLPTPRPEDLPGVPVAQMPEPAAKQLFAFAQDDFCYCGCPHTVQGCLKEHKGCKHAQRMMLLGYEEAMAGAKSAEITKALNDYYASFAPEKRTSFDLSKTGCTGPANAPVTIVEFSDFECPFCRMARPILEELVKQEAGKVRLCFKPFPLQAHPHSGPAAEAAMFALEHGKFWEMHDLMFENQQALENDDLKKYAQQLGLDANDLLKAINEQRYAAQITASKEEGKKAGVNGTPSIYLNGRFLTLPPAPEVLQHSIDDELEWKQNGGKWAAD